MSASESQEGGSHYKDMVVQPWDIIDGWPYPEKVAYYRGNALKYLLRLNDKDCPLLNCKKAGHYIQKLRETIENG